MAVWPVVTPSLEGFLIQLLYSDCEAHTSNGFKGVHRGLTKHKGVLA